MAAEAGAHGGKDLLAEGVVDARAKSGEQCRGQHLGRRRGLDGGIDRPAALARIRDVARIGGEFLIGGQRLGGQVEQPGGDDRTAAPDLGDLGNLEVEAIVGRQAFLGRGIAQQVEALVEQFKGVIEANGGAIRKVEYWGVKSLGYRIKKNRKAHYTLLNIEGPSAAVLEMERQMRINEDILRFMTVKVDELEEGPSAMLQKRDRDDRPERGGDRFERGPRRDRPRREDEATTETAEAEA